MKHNADRLNRMQIREQQLINRERQRQIEAEERSQTQAVQRTKQQYSHVSSHGYGSPNSTSTELCNKGGRGDGRDRLPSIARAEKRGAAVRMERPALRGRGTVAMNSAVDGNLNASDGSRSSHHVHSADADDAEVRVYVRECDGDDARQIRYRESESEVYTTANAPEECADTRPGGGGDYRDEPDDAEGNHRAMRPRGNDRVGAREDQRAAPVRNPAPRPAATRAGPSSTTDLPGSHTRGAVPRYLQQRKAELHAEKQAIVEHAQQMKEMAKIPPGHRLVDDAEKAYTIEKLNERKAELELQLHKIPIRFDTESIKTRRRNIEEELSEIEMSKKKYSGNKPLYVPAE